MGGRVMEENSELKTAWEFVEMTGKSVFLTGKAGTGKTTFLRKVVEESRKRVVVVAPTGIAAINAGGVTIHSFFQLPFHPFIPGTVVESRFAFSKEKRNVIKAMDVLVIDEISMVRSDLLDAVDSVLRRFRDKSKPFGGVQLIMIGDLQQLTPVLTSSDSELLTPHYSTPYFYGSHALKQLEYVTIELKEVYRQRDSRFISILNSVRSGFPSQNVIALLNERYDPSFVPDPESGYIRLTTHNNAANSYNEQQLEQIEEPSHFFDAVIEGDFPEYLYPTEKSLELKVGAQVMFVRNDPSRSKRYFNGKIGIVKEFGEGYIEVQCQDEKITVEKLEWENCKYVIDEETQEVMTDVLGVFRQYPLRLAWAITIHKSQGLTFEKAIIDAAYSFASGQVYVALSRCTTLEGMVLAAPLKRGAVRTDQNVVQYIKVQKDAAQQIVSRLESIKLEYHKEQLARTFDFSELVSLQKKLLEVSLEFPSGSVVGLAQKHNTVLNSLEGLAFSMAAELKMLIIQSSVEEISSDDFNSMIKGRCADLLRELGTIYDESFEKLHDISARNSELVKKYKTIWDDLHMELDSIRYHLKSMSETSCALPEPSSESQTTANEVSEVVSKGIETPEQTPKANRRPAKKKKKEDTKVITYDLYKKGHSMKEITEIRELTPSTIAKHLAHYVAEGMIAIEELVPSSKVEVIREAVSNLGSAERLTPIKELCPPEITYEDIVLVLSGMNLPS